MSVFVSLHEKSLPFVMQTVDLVAQENHGISFSAMSLTRRVPTFVHGKFCLSESSAISEYINEVFDGTSLYPEEPKAKAMARQVQAWLRSDFMPIRNERSTEVIFYRPIATSLSSAAKDSVKKLFAAAERLLPIGAENLFGQWSITDVDLALMLNRLALNGDQIPERLANYAKHQWARPSVQLWVNMERPPL